MSEDQFMKLFNYMEKRFDTVEQRFDATDKKIDNIQTMLDFLIGEYDIIKSEQEILSHDSVRANEVLEEFDKRLTKLEKIVDRYKLNFAK